LRAMLRLMQLRRLLIQSKYSPDQPRVPAGNPDGGQWTTDDGAISAAASGMNSSTVLIDAGNASEDDSSDPLQPHVQFVASRVTIDYAQALTGISTIDDTTKKLTETLAHTMQIMDFIPTWSPQQYGTAVHVAFGTAVRFAGFPGIGSDDVEQSFIGGKVVD